VGSKRAKGLNLIKVHFEIERPLIAAAAAVAAAATTLTYCFTFLSLCISLSLSLSLSALCNRRELVRKVEVG
jgi:hypothetical protein